MGKMFLYGALVAVCLCASAQSQSIANTRQPQEEGEITKRESASANKMPRPAAFEPHQEQLPGGVARVAHGLKSWFFRVAEDPIALFTLVLAVFTVRLWRSTHRLAISAEDSTSRQLRAYLMVTGVECKGDAKYVVWMQNFGHTPVKQTTFWASRITHKPESGYGRNTPEHESAFGRGDASEIEAGPAAPGYPHQVNCNFGPSGDPGSEVFSKKLAVYVYGSISYDDGYGNQRISNFRFMRRGGPGWTDEGELERCNAGNDIT